MKNIVLITGGGKRLGSLIARELSKESFHIVLHYNKSEKEALETKEDIIKNGGKIHLIRKEITFETDAIDLICESINILEDIENQQFTLINNASAFKYDQGHDFTENILDEHIHANFKIPTLLMKSLNNQLSEKLNGNVINMLDAKLYGLNPDHYTYTLSKFALLGLTKVASLSYAPKMRVNGIAPGFTLPNPEHGAEDFKRIQRLNPLHKGPNPSDLINAVKFLIKTLSITGENILIDGGAHLSPQKRDATFL